MLVDKKYKFVPVTITIETHREETVLLDLLEEFLSYRRLENKRDDLVSFAINLHNELGNLIVEEDK